MRSLIVTTWFPDVANPSRTPFCLEHVRAAKAAGVEVSVVHVMLREAGRVVTEDYESVRVTRVPLALGDVRGWLPAFRALRRGLSAADVLHTMAFSSALVAAIPWLVRRRPWVHTEHWNGVTSPDSVGGWWRYAAFLRHVLRLPDQVTAVTAELANAMTRFTRAGALSVLPCVVRTPEHIPAFAAPEPLRLVGVGLLIPRKEPLLAVDTVAWLRDRGVSVTFDWVGCGPLEDDVRHRVADLALTGHVHLLGAVTPDKVQQIVAESHIFFVPSRQENFFTAVAESIAVGRPAVVPRSGGFVDYCQPENSELVDAWTPDALGSAILRMRERIAGLTPQQVSATLDAQFSESRVSKLILDVYARALTSRMPRGLV